ncbi:META domain-containing protein [Hyphococcus luteus]|uniref:Secreted protein containing HslJ-like protein n=1 Tax=Hyphococcus luteus TaxID=2058213 RepID=A0A2S7K3I5_9PROT|nr:META domain-containing protein [Marinicaulis flavus]PQA87051.1 secreted protein containing HslJ-like protein [Marinicaulis flavus]
MSRSSFLFIGAALFLASCDDPAEIGDESETAAAAQPAQSFAAIFQCGDKRIRFSGAGENATLETADETFSLMQTRTASGARYEDPENPGTYIWNKGKEATISIRGGVLEDCVAVEESQRATERAFDAQGNEPGWRLEIARGELSLTWNYGEDELSAPAPEPQEDGAVTRYAIPDEDLVITTREEICHDDATGMPHPFRVSVDIRGQTLHGCGGDPASLLSGEWVVEDINGGGVIDNSHATLSFSADGRLAGRGSCNNYSAAYTLGPERFSIGPIAATKKACPPALMEQERKLFDSLAKTRRFEIDDAGALILIGEHGARLLARRTD